MDESTLLYQEGEPDGDGEGRQVVLQLPEGCDTTDGVIMQIEGDKIHIITQGGQLGGNPLGIAMESIMQVQDSADSQLQITDSAAVADSAELRITDAEDAEDDPEPAEVEDVEGADSEIQATEVEQVDLEDTPDTACFVCSEPCSRPARLLLSRTAGSGASLAERLASLLPLRLHCSAADGVCRRCRQLIEQADLHHTQLKDVELRVRQLFRLEERLEEEERRQEQEQEAARHRQQELARRQERERRRQQEQEQDKRLDQERRRRQQEQERDKERRREEIRRRQAARTAQNGHQTSESFPFAADDDFDSGDEASSVQILRETSSVQILRETSSAPAPPPPPPPPAASDVNDEDWTPRKKYVSRRRRRPRRCWSPSDASVSGAAATQEQEARDEARDGRERSVSLSEPTLASAQAGLSRTAESAAAEDQDQEPDEEAQESGQNPPDDVPTTTIEFVSIDGLRGRGGAGGSLAKYGLMGSGPAGRRAALTPAGFYCRRCDKQFDSSSALVTHITTTHTRPWCRRCRSEFDTATQLSQHRRQCRSECPLCGVRPADLAKHLRFKHPAATAGTAIVEEDGQGRGTTEKATKRVEEEAGTPRVPEVATPARPRQASRDVTTAAASASPTVIEFNSVSTLREQVKNVKTPRFSLKFRRVSSADLERIQHLNVNNKRLGTQPNAARPHTCLRCGQHLGSLKEQIVHLHTVHKGKSWCRRCRTEFSSKQANIEHRAACKKLNAEGECVHCGKHVKNLKIHLKTHESPGKRKRESVMGPDGKMVSASLAGGVCHICKKYVPHRLKRHVASHVQHPCPICKKLFSREDVIAGHIKRVHMKERPYICNHCGKGFVSLYSMQRHEMIHTNSYRFYCQECGDGFRQKQQLTAHMRHKHGVVEIEFEDVRESAILGEMTDGTVTTELRFYCQECGSGFHSRRQLTAHMRNKHGVANVVFEDVQLHVAGTIEHLEAVTVAEEVAQAADTDAVGALTEQETDPAGAADDRQDWWNADQTTAY